MDWHGVAKSLDLILFLSLSLSFRRFFLLMF